MSDEPAKEITQLLQQWRRGDDDAREALVPLLYGELRRIARNQMRQERGAHTLQPTALVHEAYARLIRLELPWQDRSHFLGMAARLMRQVLVDHARAKRAAKRAADHVPLSSAHEVLPAGGKEAALDLLTLDVTLQRLQAIDPRQAEILELHYFGGMSYEEIGEVMNLSLATVGRELRHGRAWLRREIEKR